MATKGKIEAFISTKTIDQSEVQKHPGGRPPFFNTPEELEDKITEYFAEGGTNRTFICGSGTSKYSVNVTIYTITGLCLHCGFDSRQSFYDYEEKKEFTYIIKKARLEIEKMYEENLQYGNTTGSIFALKNMGWKDNQGIDHTGIPPSVNVNVTTQQAADKVKEFLKDELE